MPASPASTKVPWPTGELQLGRPIVEWRCPGVARFAFEARLWVSKVCNIGGVYEIGISYILSAGIELSSLMDWEYIYIGRKTLTYD